MEAHHIQELKNHWQGRAVVVCGCGPSITRMERPSEYLTIGVNDVPRWFAPDFLMVTDWPRSLGEERWPHTASYTGAVLTQIPASRWARETAGKGYDEPQWSGIYTMELANVGDTKNGNLRIGQPFNVSSNSPFMACMVALYMGAQRIGLLGVDIFGHGIEDNVRTLTDFTALRVFANQNGRELLCLSPLSKLVARGVMPLTSLEVFSDSHHRRSS